MRLVTAWKDKQYSQETIGWWHLPKVELKHTLYGKAGAGSNPALTTNLRLPFFEFKKTKLWNKF
jgi:hypothetical protein